jgi:hypothetical protein
VLARGTTSAVVPPSASLRLSSPMVWLLICFRYSTMTNDKTRGEQAMRLARGYPWHAPLVGQRSVLSAWLDTEMADAVTRRSAGRTEAVRPLSRGPLRPKRHGPSDSVRAGRSRLGPPRPCQPLASTPLALATRQT